MPRTRMAPQQSVQLPGYPPNVRFTPEAAAQVAARPVAQQNIPQPYAAVNPQPQYMNQPQYMGVNPQYYTGSYAPFGQIPQQNQQFGMQGMQVPQPTDQNTQLPSQQYLDASRNQPASTNFGDYIRDAFGTIIGVKPRTDYGRWQYDLLWGEPPKVDAASRFTNYQQSALNYLTQGGLQGLSQTPFNFAPIANQQLERFHTQTIPSIAERFTALGGGQRSSAFQGALGNAGRFLGNDLAALQGQYNLQQQGNLLNLINLGLTPQFENVITQGGQGAIPGLAKAGVELGKAYLGAGGATSVGDKPQAGKA